MFTIQNVTIKSFEILVTFLSSCTKLQFETSAGNLEFQLVKYLGWEGLARRRPEKTQPKIV